MRVDELVDVLLLDDQRRGQGDDVAGRADQAALLESLDEGGEGPLRRLAADRLQLDGADQADVADVDDVPASFSECSASSQYCASSAPRVSSPSSL